MAVVGRDHIDIVLPRQVLDEVVHRLLVLDAVAVGLQVEVLPEDVQVQLRDFVGLLDALSLRPPAVRVARQGQLREEALNAAGGGDDALGVLADLRRRQDVNGPDKAAHQKH
jgi:hypothetical protein